MKKSLLIFALLTLVSPLSADDLEYAMQAYEKGNYPVAYRKLLYLAERSNAKAQFNLGKMYYFGDGVEKDEKKAFEWLKNAIEQYTAESGDLGAQNRINTLRYSGVMHYFNTYFGGNIFGDKVEQDEKTLEWLKKVASWIKTSAEKGSPEAQNSLGLLYYIGWVFERDKKESEKWFRKAANQTHILAAHNLARLYETWGSRNNPKTSRQFYTLAAEQGYSPSQNRLFFLFTSRYPLDRDDYLHYPNDPAVLEGLMWLVISSVRGNGIAKETLDGINERLNYLPYGEELAERINLLASVCIKNNLKNCYKSP